MIAQCFLSAKDLLHFAMTCKMFYEAGPYDDLLLRNFVFKYKGKTYMKHLKHVMEQDCLGKENLLKLRNQQPFAELSKTTQKKLRDLYDNHLRQMLTLTTQWKEARNVKSPSCEYKPLNDITLHQHQEEALYFLMNVEKQDPLMMHVNDFMPNNKVRVPFYPTKHQTLDYKCNRKVPAGEVWQENFHLHGGMFCDEQGMGKTTTLLSLIVNHRASGDFQHEKLPLEFPHTTRSSATLIICPSQIVKQWASVIKKHAPQLRVHSVLQQSHLHKDITQEELQKDLDILIVSQAMFHRSPMGWSSFGPQMTTNHLYSLTFFRIIVDESHEFFKSTSCQGYPNRRLYAKHKWLVSGTPFPTLKHFVEYMKFFHPTNELLSCAGGYWSQSGKKHHNIVHIYEFFMRLVWKNYWRTCNSSVGCFSDANVEMHTHPFVMDEQRFLAYRFVDAILKSSRCINVRENALRMLLSCDKLPRELRFGGESRTCFVNIEKWYGDGYLSVAKDLRDDSFFALAHSNDAYASRIKKVTPVMFEILGKAIDYQIVKSIDQVQQKTFTCEHSTLSGERCQERAPLRSLWCGSRFCKEHRQTKTHQVGCYRRKIDTQSIEYVKIDTLAEMIQAIHGKDKSRKFLLFFASADDMNSFAWYITNIMQSGLKYAICSGNYSCRNKAIQNILTGKCSLMLMSWDKSPSGVDGLSEVISDIVFVDVPYGKSATSSTRQAIARCLRIGRNEEKKLHVHVYYIKDTIQEQDYLDNPVFRELLKQQSQ